MKTTKTVEEEIKDLKEAAAILKESILNTEQGFITIAKRIAYLYSLSDTKESRKGYSFWSKEAGIK